MPKIVDIEAIGAVYAKKLADAGLKTTDVLLKTGATAKAREKRIYGVCPLSFGVEHEAGMPRGCMVL